MSPPRHYCQLGEILCYGGCHVHCRMFSSNPGLYKLDATTTPTQLCFQIVTQKYPQTLLNVPWGAKSPPWRITKLTAPLAQSSYNSKLLNHSLKAPENPHSESLSLGNMTRRHYVLIQKVLGLKGVKENKDFPLESAKGKKKDVFPIEMLLVSAKALEK